MNQSYLQQIARYHNWSLRCLDGFQEFIRNLGNPACKNCMFQLTPEGEAAKREALDAIAKLKIEVDRSWKVARRNTMRLD